MPEKIVYVIHSNDSCSAGLLRCMNFKLQKKFEKDLVFLYKFGKTEPLVDICVYS